MGLNAPKVFDKMPQSEMMVDLDMAGQVLNQAVDKVFDEMSGSLVPCP